MVLLDSKNNRNFTKYKEVEGVHLNLVMPQGMDGYSREMSLHSNELMNENGSGGTAISTAPSSICVTFFIEGRKDGSS